MATSTPAVSQCLSSIFSSLSSGSLSLPPPGCLAALVSAALGYGIVAGSVGLKVPQILKVVRAKSGEGLSRVTFAIEAAAYAVTLMYRYMKV